MRSLAELQKPHTAVLVDRTELIRLCCGDVEHCDDALMSIAKAIAAELGGDLHQALERTTLTYLADVGSISLERARDLRRMTCAACLAPEQLGRWAELLVADDFDFPDSRISATFPEPKPAMAQAKFCMWWVAFLTLIFLAVA